MLCSTLLSNGRSWSNVARDRESTVYLGTLPENARFQALQYTMASR